MGCCSSSNANQPTKATPKLRRRLSIGEVDGGNENGTDLTDVERGLITEVNAANLMELLRDAAGDGGRKWSIGSQTDKDLNKRTSFANKTVQQSGDEVEVTKLGIGYSCKKGLKPESPNQDSWMILKVEGEFTIYGVFDGHGSKGHDVSQFVKENLPKVLIRDDQFRTDPQKALTNAFHKIQAMLEVATMMEKINATLSGCTCTVVVQRHSDGTIFVAHCGDSRAILGTRKGDKLQPHALTVDHKPNDKDERKRIQENGGQVIYDGFCNHRVYARGQKYPGLNMSRAMGDLMGYYDAGISATPTVSSHKLQAEDELLIVCSDGVWEFMENEDVVELVSNFSSQKSMAAAEALAKQSWERWIHEEGGMVVDDITALTIFLQHTNAAFEKQFDERAMGA